MSNATCSTFNLGFLWPTDYGTSGILKIISDREFVSGGIPFPSGRLSDPINSNFCYQAAITVSGNVATVAAITLPQTDASGVTVINGSGQPTYTAIIYSNSGTTRRQNLFENWTLATSLTTSFNFDAWAISNAAVTLVNTLSSDYYTRTQTDNAITARLNAPATTTQNGIVEISGNPADIAHPIAVETRDPRLGDVVNVKGWPYLATGNGVTDDTAAINSALTAALAGRYPLYFPAGRYLVSGSGAQIFLVNKNIEILGDGELVSIIVVANSVGNVPIMRLKPPTSVGYTVYTDQIGWHLHDFGIVSQGGEAVDISYSGGHNIVIDLTVSDSFMDKSVFERLYLGPLGGVAAGVYAIYLSQTNPSAIAGLQGSSFRDIKATNGISFVNLNDNNVLDNVDVTGVNDILITCVTNAAGPVFRNVVVTAKKGITITKAQNVLMDRVFVEIARAGSTGTADGACLSLKAVTAGDIRSVHIINSLFGTPSGPDLHGIYLKNVYSTVVETSTFNINAGKVGLSIDTGNVGTTWSNFNQMVGASTTGYSGNSNDIQFNLLPAGFVNSFTPALKFGGNSVGMAYTAQIGRYCITGQTVSVWGSLVLSAKGSSVGAATITGLPVSASSTANDFQPLTIIIGGADASLTGVPVALISASTPTTISLQSFAAGATTNLAETHFGNATVVLFNGTYHLS